MRYARQAVAGKSAGAPGECFGGVCRVKRHVPKGKVCFVVGADPQRGVLNAAARNVLHIRTLRNTDV